MADVEQKTPEVVETSPEKVAEKKVAEVEEVPVADKTDVKENGNAPAEAKEDAEEKPVEETNGDSKNGKNQDVCSIKRKSTTPADEKDATVEEVPEKKAKLADEVVEKAEENGAAVEEVQA